jgi:O-antigen/teichoic acid export membrane protein
MFAAADRSDESVRFFRGEWLKWLVIFGGAGIVVMALLREQVGILFLSPAYRGETRLLVIIGGAYLLLALGQLAENYLLAGERTPSVLRVSVWSTVASVLAAVALIPRYAAYGAAWSTFVGLGTYAGLMWLAQTDEAN